MPSLAWRVRRRLAPVAEVVRPTVASVVETLVAESEGPADPEILDRASHTMLGRIQAMPRYIGLPMMAATLAFDASGVAFGRRPFRFLPPEARARVLEAWRNAPVGVFRTFVEFYEKMGTFVYFSEKDEAAEATAGREG
ncbi:MAG: hypothetical protein JXB39_02965 [Deltaproteobacteria bacterium]|nr:hypothetical protein [Deltaproteobacteria bacterium]